MNNQNEYEKRCKAIHPYQEGYGSNSGEKPLNIWFERFFLSEKNWSLTRPAVLPSLEMGVPEVSQMDNEMAATGGRYINGLRIIWTHAQNLPSPSFSKRGNSSL